MNRQGLKPLLCLMGRNESKEQVNGRDRVGPICHCLRGSSQASASEEQLVAQAGLGWRGMSTSVYRQDWKRVQTSRI